MRNHTSCGDFKCAHCHNLVSAAHLLSGVNNRNHCPYCLWSCHLDLYVAGDRLSACKALMNAVGLTMKRSRNKYRPESRGELMLIHECVECSTLSINRIASDDDSAMIVGVFQKSLALGDQFHARCEGYGIAMLKAENTEMVYAQLHGQIGEIPLVTWMISH